MIYINWILKNAKLLLVIGFAVLLFLFLDGCRKNKNLKIEKAQIELVASQNQRALTDSLRTEKLKGGGTEIVISSFAAKIKDLEALNKDLFKEVKKELGDVKALIKARTGVNQDTLVIDNILAKYDNGLYGLKFHNEYKDSTIERSIDGESKFKLINNTLYPEKTTISKNSIKFDLILGFKEKGDNFEVFARSNSPEVSFDALKGVLIIPKKAGESGILQPPAKIKRFGLGFQVGYGVGLLDKQLMLTPYVGVGLSYNLLKF